MIILTIGAVVTSILVIISISTVYSVLWLVSTFILVSITLALYGLIFPALLYVIVYIGAIAILFLFVIQLLDLSNTESNELKTIALMQPFLLVTTLLLIIGILITNSLDAIIPINILDQISYVSSDSYYTMSHGDNNSITSNSSLLSLANTLYSRAILPLILISFILLIAMIAPIYLCL